MRIRIDTLALGVALLALALSVHAAATGLAATSGGVIWRCFAEDQNGSVLLDKNMGSPFVDATKANAGCRQAAILEIATRNGALAEGEARIELGDYVAFRPITRWLEAVWGLVRGAGPARDWTCDVLLFYRSGSGLRSLAYDWSATVTAASRALAEDAALEAEAAASPRHATDYWRAARCRAGTP